MKFLIIAFVVLLQGAAWATNLDRAPSVSRLRLKSNWKIQDSDLVLLGGAVVSTDAFNYHSWQPATVPSTVLANLAGPHLGDGTADDPFVGLNWLKLPGSGPYYPIGKNYSEVETPPTSPFGHAWWYRTEFTLTAAQVALFADLNFKGITYGAEIWLNGFKLASPAETRGSYRQFKYSVASHLKSGENVLAVLVYPPAPTDLTASWVDWNPTPQDKNMGLWREVFLDFHGAVSIQHPFVTSDIHFPKADQADLTILSDLTNASAQPVTGTLTAKTEGIEISQTVTLGPNETKTATFTPASFAALKIQKPALWWPWQMGRATLHSLELTFELNHAVSDSVKYEYGIRKMESHLTPEGSRLFSVNEKPIFIRGGGWASDLLLRFSTSRQKTELAYIRQLGLNAVRMEGRFETESFLSLTDREGILVLPGWVCCNAWQNNTTWTPEHFDIAKASLSDQLYELRAHASILAFMYGSDEAPPAPLEKIYLDALQATNWPNPSLAAASDRQSSVGKTGVKMTGPYSYTPPSYWYADKNKFGGAWGFNTETSPGVSMPPLESLKRFIPASHLNSVDQTWTFHLGENEFANFDDHRNAMIRRYGAIKDVADFVKKSEVMDYDNHRAMFEAYARNKYQSATGIIQWMLNSAWPSMLWHLYDYYLRPGSAFYGVKKANTPIHIQYSYDDQTVVVVNSTYTDQKDLSVLAKVLDLKSAILFEAQSRASVKADSSTTLFALPEPKTLSQPVYFVWLELKDASGTVVDHNFYWLSTTKETYAWDKTDFKITPVIQEADLTALEKLPFTKITATTVANADNSAATVTLKNTGSRIAFFIHLKLMANGDEILPIDWDDNNVTLLPGETRQIDVRVPGGAGQSPLTVRGSGWNVTAW